MPRFAAADFQYRLDGLVAGDEIEHQRPGLLTQAGDAAVRADEEQVEWNHGVLHPESHDTRLRRREQHALIGRQCAHVHQALLLASFVIGDADIEPLSALAAADFECRLWKNGMDASHLRGEVSG